MRKVCNVEHVGLYGSADDDLIMKPILALYFRDCLKLYSEQASDSMTVFITKIMIIIVIIIMMIIIIMMMIMMMIIIIIIVM